MTKEASWLLQEKYDGVETPGFLFDCAKLEGGTPLAYLIGHMPFLDCTIYLDSHPLIPRPETEYWVEQAITEIKKHTTSNLRDSIPKILDLCAGSGAIGVAVAKADPSAEVTFAEIDPAHLPTIEKNILSNLSVNRKVGQNLLKVVIGDLFENIPLEQKFDWILTNPPYIDAAANTVDTTVTAHEPHLALFGGDAGMELIDRIITGAPQYLTLSGQLWIEHEPAQVTAIAHLAERTGFRVITHPDQYGVPRFSVLTVAQ